MQMRLAPNLSYKFPMCRLATAILGVSFLTGCALLSGCAASHASQPDATALRTYAPAPAAALAFDPPGDAYMPYLSRDDRGEAAFGGFQDLSTEIYDVQTNDDQLYFNGASTYERRVVSDRVGDVYR